MISKKEIEVIDKKYITDYIECDMCHNKFHINKIEEDGSILQDNAIEAFQAYNMIHIRKSFGFCSIIGDEDIVEIDLCEECFIKLFGMDFINKHLVMEYEI